MPETPSLYLPVLSCENEHFDTIPDSFSTHKLLPTGQLENICRCFIRLLQAPVTQPAATHQKHQRIIFYVHSENQ